MKVHLKLWLGCIALYVLILVFILGVVQFREVIMLNCGQQRSLPESVNVKRKTFIFHKNGGNEIPLIYIITPTKPRIEQKADLTQLSQTLRLVPRIHWVLVEDRHGKSELVTNFLKRCSLNYTHLAIRTNHTEYHILQEQGMIDKRSPPAKGVFQRNLALDWITNHGEYPCIFYFADDDNTYDSRLFEQMRFTKKVSVWPVGLTGRARFQTPILRDGKVVGFVGGWMSKRKFPIDMAAFAVNSEILKSKSSPRFDHNIRKGFAKTDFVEKLNVTINELEPKADNCTKILVWHTRTQKTSMAALALLEKRLAQYNLTPSYFEI